MSSRRRAVFLDVDGTILDHAERLSPTTVAAVQGARAAGHLVYLCTGRARAEIPAPVTAIGFDGVISAGGGFVEHGDRLVASHVMSRGQLREVVGFLDAAGIEYILQGFDAVHPSTGLVELLRRVIGEHDLDWASAPDSDRLSDLDGLDDIAKATFFGESPTTFATVRDGLGDRFHILTGTIPYLGEAGGEVAPTGMNKGAAIAELVAELGVPLADVIAIGDSANDLEMLAVAGVGIAMGNADGNVKARADEVTTDVDDDGVWRAFLRHGLVAG